MIVALPVCTKDEHLALLGLRVARKLDASVPFACVVVHERGHDVKAVVEAATGYFKRVETLMYDPCPFGKEFPRPHNWSWQHTARFMNTQSEPWLWWEPDAVPCRSGWLDALDKSYRASGKAFGGHIERGNGKPYLAGVAIYPPTVASRCENAMLTRQAPFDQVLSLMDNILPSTSELDGLIYHQFASDGSGWSHNHLKLLPDSTALYHRCKSGKLQRLLLGEDEPIAITLESSVGVASHSGDRGDVIYSLPVCRELGLRNIVLFPDRCTRELMSPSSAVSLAKLIEVQPYIDSCVFAEDPPTVAFQLSGFRVLMGQGFDEQYLSHNLSALHARWAGLPEGIETEQWLWVAPQTPPKPVILSRSERYHSQTVDWKRCLDYYKGRCTFVGSPDEHAAFIKEFGVVPYLKTPDLLSLARYIAGSELFIGNQSCPYAIAEGLKHPAILEWVKGPSQNTHFSRRGLVYGTEHQPLPTLVKKKPRFDWHVLTDLHSGLGRVAAEYYRYNKAFDLRWIPTRKTEEFVEFDHTIKMYPARSGAPVMLLEAAPEIRQYARGGEVIYSMWESTRLPKSVVRALNDGLMGLVPSDWCKQVYRDSGVTTPLFKVPLGVDSNLFTPDPAFRPGEPLVFGASGRLCGDGNPRKNLDKVIAGFLKAFPTEKNVRLEIKGYDNKSVLQCSDPRVRVICDYWPVRKLVQWYRGLDAFVNLAAGGGWELHVHEAMACGVVPIILEWSSSLEFVDSFCGYMVKPKLVDADWSVYAGLGQWALPDMDNLVETFRLVHKQRGELFRRRRLAREAVAGLTWEAATRTLEHCLSKVL